MHFIVEIDGNGVKGKKYHLLFIIPTLQGGGAERVCVTLLRHFDRTQFILTLVVVDLRSAQYRDDLPPEVELIDLGCSRVRYALPKLIRIIWKKRPDVVFSMLNHLNLALAIILPLLPNTPRYLSRETNVVSHLLCEYRLSGLWRWAYRRFYRRFDAVIFQSYFMQNDAIESFSFPVEKAVVINNPVDIDRLRCMAAEYVPIDLKRIENLNDYGPIIHLVAAGELSFRKGFDLLIQALVLCGDQRLHLTLLGDGPMRQELEELAQSQGVAKQIDFVGFQKNPYSFFARADLFVLSSRFEGVPNVVLEALVCATPVVSTPIGGIKNLLEGVGGCLIAEEINATALAEAITQWASAPKRVIPDTATEPYRVECIVKQYTDYIVDHLLH